MTEPRTFVFGKKSEAREVIERMQNCIDRYRWASVSDLYDLCGIRSTYVDHRWGWHDLTDLKIDEAANDEGIFVVVFPPPVEKP